MMPRILRGLALIAATGTSPVASGAVSADVHLRDAPSVFHSGAVLLGDLATIRGTDLPTVRALTHFPLPGLVRRGTSRRYLRRDIERLVAREVPVDRVRWMGADAVAVQIHGIEVPGAAMEQTARIGLLALLAPHGRYRVQAVNRVEPVMIPPGQLTVRVRPVLIEPRRSTQSVAIEILVDGELVRTMTLSFLAQQLQAAVVPLASAQPRAPDMAPARVPAAATADPVPIIVRGQQVSVRSKAGTLHIEGQGEALEDGARGQSLDVRTSAGLRVRATVVAPGKVEVTP